MNILTTHAAAKVNERPSLTNDRSGNPDERVRSNEAGVFTLLLPQIQQAVQEQGYTVPTPIQDRAIPQLLAGRDLIGCAQTGTGKTAAFVLPILQYLTVNKKQIAIGRARVLILAPTRELAAQIDESIKVYGRCSNCTHAVIFGGVNQQSQVNQLKRGPAIIVATPGRLLDLVQQGYIRLDGTEIFVLDEADRMLDMGFFPDIQKIIAGLPAKRQSLFFSATMAPEVVALARTLVRDAIHVTVPHEAPAVERIIQRVMFVDKNKKDALLTSLLSQSSWNRILVFTQMKHMANRVVKKLAEARIPATAIHGNKSQSARMEALADFKSGRARVLVATDIAARGLDVDGISHVINYDLPLEPEVYIHRIGRTARAGASGDAISFCAANERDMLFHIEKLIGIKVPVDTTHRFHSVSASSGEAHETRPPERKWRNGNGKNGMRRRSNNSSPRRNQGFRSRDNHTR